MTVPLSPMRLSDLAGGPYGIGASVASTGAHPSTVATKVARALAGGGTFHDELQFYQYYSDRNKHSYTTKLGKIHYAGNMYPASRGISDIGESVRETFQSFTLAHHYFSRVANAMWYPLNSPQNQPGPIFITDPQTGSKTLPAGFNSEWGRRKLSKEDFAELKKPAAVSAMYLGRMYLRGEGVEADYLMARMWLRRASDFVSRGTSWPRSGHHLIWSI